MLSTVVDIHKDAFYYILFFQSRLKWRASNFFVYFRGVFNVLCKMYCKYTKILRSDRETVLRSDSNVVFYHHMNHTARWWSFYFIITKQTCMAFAATLSELCPMWQYSVLGIPVHVTRVSDFWTVKRDIPIGLVLRFFMGISTPKI